MRKGYTVLFFCSVLFVFNIANAGPQAYPKEYSDALELIHAYSGNGDELERAQSLIHKLAQMYPDKGYAHALLAEMLSTWQLDQHGKPVKLRNEIKKLASDAIHLNPKLAQAYVARARVWLRSAEINEAKADVKKALKIEPNLSGALFLQADIYRRLRDPKNAEIWYLKFIESATSDKRKSNGYYWLGRAYADEAYENARMRKEYIEKAKGYFQKNVALSPDGAWVAVNFAIFLNAIGADFVAAEEQASKALKLMNFPMARYNYAIAKYQQLLVKLDSMSHGELESAVKEIEAATTISLGMAIDFRSAGTMVQNRLLKIQKKLMTDKH